MGARAGAKGDQGEKGEKGDPGLGVSKRVAGQNISALRVVKLVGSNTATYADQTEIADATIVDGITINAANLGDDVMVQNVGSVSDLSWNWTPGAPLFCGEAGQLTASPPASGWLMQVASATGPTSILVKLNSPILLA